MTTQTILVLLNLFIDFSIVIDHGKYRHIRIYFVKYFLESISSVYNRLLSIMYNIPVA